MSTQWRSQIICAPFTTTITIFPTMPPETLSPKQIHALFRNIAYKDLILSLNFPDFTSTQIGQKTAPVFVWVWCAYHLMRLSPDGTFKESQSDINDFSTQAILPEDFNRAYFLLRFSQRQEKKYKGKQPKRQNKAVETIQYFKGANDIPETNMELPIDQEFLADLTEKHIDAHDNFNDDHSSDEDPEKDVFENPHQVCMAQDGIQGSCQKVQYQQAFASRKGSHYIYIRPDMAPEDIPIPDRNTASQAAGERDEANPWLRRTPWPVYSTNIAPNHLANCIQRPENDTMWPDELVARAIWEAMGPVACISQQVITQLGHFIRIEAIRTERHQTRHTPHQAYIDEESIAEHVRPWQQMLMFFGRTQIENEWTSPQYRFTPRQRKTWRVLWQVATTEEADQRHSISPDHEQMTKEEEEEEEKGQGDTQAGEEHKFKLTKIQMACLDFCIELVKQRVQVEDYEWALVNGLAVVGRGEYGWGDAESYAAILSRIMVVHKAVRLDANASDMLGRNQASHIVGD
ncbi:hypothetical protein ACJ73_08189 [Blastomyces percursus]|uniref:Uncharacterized protein n=1 Tax=Blastomyces percursus TaxID=1658174 RepID=A0A1J9QYU9_9EURO|nr:hypothetical protein ACJ73_08189 [Blastomyces percursus]